MSQYCSRIHIKLKDEKDAELLTKLDFGSVEFDCENLFSVNDLDYTIFGECSYYEDEITTIVKKLAEGLKDKGLIIADTTNINVDPYTYVAYSINGKVHTHYFLKGIKAEMFDKTDIDDIKGWFAFGKFKLSEQEDEELNNYYID